MLFEHDEEAAEQYPYMHNYTNYMKKMTRPLVGREHEMQQVMAAMMKPEYCNVLLLAEAGAGKGHPVEDLIAVADSRGYIPVGSLAAGDQVFDENGMPVTVLGIYPQGRKEVFRVVFEDGSEVRCNDEHFWDVRNAMEREAELPFHTMTAREILDAGLTAAQGGPRWSIPVGKALQRRPGMSGRGVMTSGPDERMGYLRDRLNGGSTIECSDEDEVHKLKALITSLGLRAPAVPAGNGRTLVRVERGRQDLGIVSIEDLGYETEMVCIWVDSRTHRYQMGLEHNVTHNTALVQGIMVKDTSRTYLEVDLSKMIANLKNENEMADRLKTLFDEVSRFRRDRDREIVLFIDEFHQIVQLSAAAVEVLKPLLADSGTRGIRVIAATTHIEYQQFIAPNLPLVERLQRIKLVQPGEDVVVSILRSMCERYNVHPPRDTLFSDIYTYTNRYIPATSQPRKSILILDSMIGWHRLTGRPLDRKLLADVIYETEGINVAFRVDASSIKKKLDEKVLAQQVATTSIEQRLQICVAGLNNPNRPMSSFLFTGSTGVGKSQTCSTIIPVWTPDGSAVEKRAGDIVPGDFIFDREGRPTKVLGVFPQGKREVYRVTLGDGRHLDVSDNHLWAVFPAKRARDEGYTIYETKTLMRKGLVTYHKDRPGMKYFIPMNGALQRPARSFRVDPYVIGVLIGDGNLSSENELHVSSVDEFVVNKVAERLGATCRRVSGNLDWNFNRISDGSRIHQKDILGDIPELFHVKSPARRIPRAYMSGSVEQRWDLVNGLFDTDGTICQSDGDRFNISYSTFSEGLAYDLQELLFYLGVPSSVNCHVRERDGREMQEFDVHVFSRNCDKRRFFTLPRHLEAARRAAGVNRQREKSFDYVGIRSIEDTGRQEEMVCFYVDNDEHLYQAGLGVVTHNTETTKQLAAILYDDDRNLIRFDMTEYALPESLTRFRQELTRRVATIPYCIVLLDEIEKACAPVTRLLLQVLDDGRLMDENEREVTFKNAYIIITTNAGNEIYKTISNYEQNDKADFKMLEKYDKLIRESIKSQSGSKFPPELLGRIDCIVPFQPLSKRTMMGIVQQKLKSLSELVKRKHGVTLHVHKNIFIYLIYDKLDTDSDAGGARVVVSKLERELTVPLSRYINEHPMEKEIYVSVGGAMAIMNKKQLETEAYIYVGPEFAEGSDADLAGIGA